MLFGGASKLCLNAHFPLVVISFPFQCPIVIISKTGLLKKINNLKTYLKYGTGNLGVCVLYPTSGIGVPYIVNVNILIDAYAVSLTKILLEVIFLV